jgi:hypothetical protein
MPVAPVSEPPTALRAERPEQRRASAGSVDELFGEGNADGQDEEVEAPLWRNPYLITLAVLGVVLTVGGVSLFRWAVDQVYTGQYMGVDSSTSDARQDWLWVQVAWGLAPLLAIAGALTVLGIFFFLATKWSPRRRDDSDADDEFDE